MLHCHGGYFYVGFGSLGHFVTTFTERFGVRPSDVKRGARVPALRVAV